MAALRPYRLVRLRPALQQACAAPTTAALSTSTPSPQERSYRLLVVGAGTGGCAIANTFARSLPAGSVGVLEPSQYHYNQPLWTLVGGGLKPFSQSEKYVKDILGNKVEVLRDAAVQFDPDNNTVHTMGGDKLKYDFLVVAVGMQLNYSKIPGLLEALELDPSVCSNYHPKYVRKTFPAAQTFTSGNALFTFPNTPVKCAGAPQKICYVLDDFMRREGKRDKATFIYNTSLPVIFGIPRYAETLMKIVKERDVVLNLRTNLASVDHEKKIAVFDLLDKPGETLTYEYSLLHATPPMSAPHVLHASPLVDETNFVAVNRDTLQHSSYSNVFAIGDCSNAPTAKTAAAVASQAGTIKRNLKRVMAGKSPDKTYNGYTSCPLITARRSCVFAEFGYDGSILETFPLDQSRERRSMYHVKADVIPHIYWKGLVKGYWNGPGFMRRWRRFGRD